MKKLALSLAALFMLAGCSQDEANQKRIAEQKAEIALLDKELSGLKSQITDIKIDNGTAKYVLTLKIKQTHFTLDLDTHIKDSMNAIEIQIPVDKEYYDSLKVGTVIDDTFRVGSLVLYGSIGNWNIEVIDKEVK